MSCRTFKIGIAALLVLSVMGCMDPVDRRPGLRLSGEVVSEVINDWSFSDEFQEIYLETQTWYGVPHSVTTVCAGLGKELYIPSIYFEGGEWPDKYWNSNVDSDPFVRLEMGGEIYEREAVVLEDPAEIQLALRALGAKYPFWKELLAKPVSERPDMALLRMKARGG
jgi:hypothetical protein